MARTTFRPGQELDPRTLNYFSEMVMEAIRHLRLALGTGYIFFGFDVREERERGLLEVSPGLAFDGAGQAIALENPLPLPFPDEEGPLWLALRHHLLVDERNVADEPTRERDSVEVIWLTSVPRDDQVVPLARLHHAPAGWVIDRSVARRAPSLAHRHTGTTLPDRSGRLRYDGAPVRLTAPGGTGDAPPERLERLESAVEVEFNKLHTLLGDLSDEGKLQGIEIEELRLEVAEAVERAGAAGQGGTGEWQAAIAALREELSLTVGEEVREELDLLRTEVTALAQRPPTMGADLGGFTPVQALHGIGEKYATLLNEAGIETVSELLAVVATPEGRRRLEATDLPLASVRRWSHEADLLRLHGVGPGEAQLLDTAGINSTAALTEEKPNALFNQLRKAAADRGDAGAPPLAWVESWIEQAKHLPPVVEW